MEKLDSIPSKDTAPTPQEAQILDQFFPTDTSGKAPVDDDKPPTFWERLDLKYAGMVAVLFALVANPWVDGVLTKIPYVEGTTMVFGTKVLLFFLVMVLMNVFV